MVSSYYVEHLEEFERLTKGKVSVGYIYNFCVAPLPEEGYDAHGTHVVMDALYATSDVI